MIGVDYELFWRLNPKSLSPFVKAFELKHELQQKMDDKFAWLQGSYIRMAIASCMNKDAKYPKKPISLTTSLPDKQQMSQDEMKQRFINHARLVNTRFSGKEVANGKCKV